MSVTPPTQSCQRAVRDEMLADPGTVCVSKWPTFARRRRILFIGESVTLAHVAQPFTLAQSLCREQRKEFDVVFAADRRFQQLFDDCQLTWHDLYSIPSERFADNLQRGRPLFDVPTLRRYVQDDLALIERVQPDIVVGDLRLSLSISARVAGVPYLAIMNAYWSPGLRQHFPVPPHWLIQYTGLPFAQFFFNLVRPLAFAHHSLPVNRVRREFGLASLGHDVRRIWTDADHTLFADLPELYSDLELSVHHHFVGPLLWSPSVERPPWWERLPTDRPIVYVNLGSSGNATLLPLVITALRDASVHLVVATAGKVPLDTLPSDVSAAEFVSGNEACERATVVICNGGSPTVYQALSVGKPVLGITENIDQMLNMGVICRSGAGIAMRAQFASPRAVLDAVRSLLNESNFHVSAQSLGESMSNCASQCRFARLVHSIPDRAQTMEA